MNRNKIRLFIDMDGTLAEWKNCEELSDLYKQGYFASLQPLAGSVDCVSILSQKYDVYILSAVLDDSPYARQEKEEWLKKYLPQISRSHILFSADGKSKRDFVKTKFGKVSRSDVLLDDYSKNLDDWSKEGTSVKFLNGINAKRGRLYDYSISAFDHPVFNAWTMDKILQTV